MAAKESTTEFENTTEEKLLRAIEILSDIPPVVCAKPLKEFNVKGGGIDVILKATSSYEATLRTAFVLGECEIFPSSLLVCESVNDASSLAFEYNVKKSQHDSCTFPRVVLRRKVVNAIPSCDEPIEPNNDNIGRHVAINTNTSSSDFNITSCMFIGGMEPQNELSQIANLKNYKLVYVTPEMLHGQLMEALSLLDAQENIERIVFDEAHTISTWGSTFRPKYKEIAESFSRFNAPKLLLSATVPLRIQEQLRDIFGKDSWEIVADSVYSSC